MPIGYRPGMSINDLNDLDLPELFQELVAGAHLDQLIRLSVDEDLGERGDVTTLSHPAPESGVSAVIRSREAGTLAGVPALDRLLRLHAARLSWWWSVEDGDRIEPGEVICRISGALADLLPVERILLNLLGRLSGVASLTARYVHAVDDSPVLICDTRKTTPGYRCLEKYAVRCGGGHLHRIGLYDAFLLKDNHVGGCSPDEFAARVLASVRRARAEHELRFVEVEVDSLAQMEALLGSDPAPDGRIDIILLDNMTPRELAKAVAWRDANAPLVLLEASGGVTFDSLDSIARSGVERIAIGALTHSAVQLDFGLDLE